MIFNKLLFPQASHWTGKYKLIASMNMEIEDATQLSEGLTLKLGEVRLEALAMQRRTSCVHVRYPNSRPTRARKRGYDCGPLSAQRKLSGGKLAALDLCLPEPASMPKSAAESPCINASFASIDVLDFNRNSLTREHAEGTRTPCFQVSRTRRASRADGSQASRSCLYKFKPRLYEHTTCRIA